MKILTTLLTLLTLTTSTPLPTNPQTYQPETPSPPPTHFGVLLFRAFELLDIYGPLDILQLLAHNRHLTLSLLSRSLSPVTTKPAGATMNPFQSDFWPTIQPTHTFSHPPTNLQVLIVPGGPGVRSNDLLQEISFIKQIFPSLEYLITICTGASLAAQAGVLDGYRATTNKAAWWTITPLHPNVNWTVPARWVDDGKVWSSSGVTAGMDLMYAFLREKYPDGEKLAQRFEDITEFVSVRNSSWDPWAEKFNITTATRGVVTEEKKRGENQQKIIGGGRMKQKQG
ncbi:class I glutamine amidotransferase-like protein [Podospora fimiseda]|uniref:Class I glutamine amidotransferase-like protein n=1 Tax=Podospora fimiseda TaxID=252190 RepID=A0AAN7H155_9PEZI|nr:class I glutamine amidotransferase-like protein [Podospora fimiseda]